MVEGRRQDLVKSSSQWRSSRWTYAASCNVPVGAVLQPDARWVNTGGPTGSEQRGCNNCAGDRNGRESDLMERWPFAEFLLFESHPSSDSSQVLNEEHRRLQSNNHDLQAAMIDWLCA